MTKNSMKRVFIIAGTITVTAAVGYMIADRLTDGALTDKVKDMIGQTKDTAEEVKDIIVDAASDVVDEIQG